MGKNEPVWGLLVVSSAGQAETLPHQRAWAQEAAKSRGWRLTRVIEGVASGKAGPRRLVRELLNDLRALEPEDRPKCILMLRLDRLGRGSAVEAQIVLRDLNNLGVSIFTRDQGAVRIDSAMDELISAATLAVARHENDVRRDKALAMRRRKSAAGEPCGTAPYGLRIENKTFVTDPDRAAVVREAFALRIAANGYQVIGRRLTAIAPPSRYKNSSGRNKNGSGRIVHWTPSRLHKLFTNRAYVAAGIIDEATFARAQQVAPMLTNHRTQGNRKYQWPLSGVLRCHCGNGLIGFASGTSPCRYRYYGCRARWEHNDRHKLNRAERIEEQFVELLSRMKASTKLIERFARRAAAPSSSKMLERSVTEAKAALSEIARQREKAFELHASGKVRAEDVQERLDALAERRDELQGRLTNAQDQLSIAKQASKRERDVEALIARAARIWKRASVDERNVLARACMVEFGGFYVDKTGKLLPGPPPS